MTKAPFTVTSYDVPDVLKHLHDEIEYPRLEEKGQTLPRFVIRLYWKWKLAARRAKAWLRGTLRLSSRN